MSVWLLIVSDTDERDPRAILARLMHDLHASAITEGERLLGWVISDSDDDARKRIAARERQRKSRARKTRDMSHAESVTSHSENGENFDPIGGVIHSLSALKGQERVSEAPNGHAMSHVTGHADASQSSPDAAAHQLPPLTDDQRDVGREQSKAILERMRNGEL